MTPEQENKWREEFRIFFFEGSEFWHNSNTAISIEKYSEPYKQGVQGYIEARKKAQEEIDELKEELEGQLAKKDEIIKELWKLRQLTQYCWEKEAEIIEKKIKELEQ